MKGEENYLGFVLSAPWFGLIVGDFWCLERPENRKPQTSRAIQFIFVILLINEIHEIVFLLFVILLNKMLGTISDVIKAIDLVVEIYW